MRVYKTSRFECVKNFDQNIVDSHTLFCYGEPKIRPIKGAKEMAAKKGTKKSKGARKAGRKGAKKSAGKKSTKKAAKKGGTKKAGKKAGKKGGKKSAGKAGTRKASKKRSRKSSERVKAATPPYESTESEASMVESTASQFDSAVASPSLSDEEEGASEQ